MLEGKLSNRVREIAGTIMGIIVLLVVLPVWLARSGARKYRIVRLRLQGSLWCVGWQLRDRWRGGQKRLSAGNRALLQAALTGNVHNVEVLLQRGADANQLLMYDSPLLLHVAEMGYTDVVRLLLEAGAEVDAPNPSTQYTPLMRAARNGHHLTVAVLLEHGANIEAANIVGNTPLLLAAMEGHSEVVQQLLHAYTIRNMMPKQGRAAMNIAKKLEFQEIVEMLENVGVMRRKQVPRVVL